MYRTHQIRLQIAACGALIAGDTRYAPVQGMLHDTATRLKRDAHSSSNGGSRDSRENASVLFGPEPERICLQACSLQFDWQGQIVSYEALAPWWHDESAPAEM